MVVLSAWTLAAQPAPKVTSPKDQLGFNLGDDYQVANYTQLDAYWHKLASESDRMKLVDIGAAILSFLIALAGGCEREQDRPLRFEPHVYRGTKAAALTDRQRQQLQERGKLQR